MGARIFLGLFGLVATAFGITCFVNPELLEAFAGVAATSTTGRIELRAMYGGLQIAFGVLALLGTFRPGLTQTALVATAILCAGLGSSRLLGAIAASEISTYTRGGLVFELGSTVIAALSLRHLRQISRR